MVSAGRLFQIAIVSILFGRGVTGSVFSPKTLTVLVLASQVPFAGSCMVNSPIETSIHTDVDTTNHETNIGGGSSSSSETSSSTDVSLGVGKHRFEHHSESHDLHVGVETTVLSFIVIATILLVLVIGCFSAWIYNRYAKLTDTVNVTASSPANYSLMVRDEPTLSQYRHSRAAYALPAPKQSYL